MTGVDTNVLVRLLTADDRSQHRRAVTVLSELESRGEKARIDAIVLCELTWVLASGYALDRGPIAEALESLLDAAVFEIEDRQATREAIARYRAGGGELSDHLLGLRNRRAGCDRTLTFDKKLRRSPDFAML